MGTLYSCKKITSNTSQTATTNTTSHTTSHTTSNTTAVTTAVTTANTTVNTEIEPLLTLNNTNTTNETKWQEEKHEQKEQGGNTVIKVSTIPFINGVPQQIEKITNINMNDAAKLSKFGDLCIFQYLFVFCGIVYFISIVFVQGYDIFFYTFAFCVAMYHRYDEIINDNKIMDEIKMKLSTISHLLLSNFNVNLLYFDLYV